MYKYNKTLDQWTLSVDNFPPNEFLHLNESIMSFVSESLSKLSEGLSNDALFGLSDLINLLSALTPDNNKIRLLDENGKPLP